ncbi:MAG: hypothetical protein AVDCRST_MAG72-2035 [uncultured Nocardioidaceae bacterium]|uniref:Aminoglycoside phosphotransferase domain-containing protein n=1 Tax=uncultured Nocardioidaceae bacterium TaxID=253824 RepID=A0A6J4MGB9_9ACTN|nr:MAG: hypothetical protein AVDCRST_MAG72-2035 [uncultured Nocardioidaceae bacterium]
MEPVPHGHTARRLQWAHLPPPLRRTIEARLGSPVVEARSQDSGFTPGFASRLTGRDGSELFVKAANKLAQRPFADAYAEEARKLRLLPPDLPVPRLLWSLDEDAWTVLGFECVDGDPPRRPWVRAELDACLDTLAVVAERLDPAPAGLGLRPITEELPGLRTGWDQVRTSAPDWPHLDEASELARSFVDFTGNDAFVHSDARDDNFLITGSGGALLCDWNWPTRGPVWLDAVDLLASAYGDGLDAQEILATHPLTKDADPDHVDAWLAALCGFMMENRAKPAPSSSPYLRVHAGWWAEATWAWLAARRGWA